MSNIIKAKTCVNKAQTVLRHFQDFNFVNSCKNVISLGYNGENLKQNIFNEWLFSNSITCDEPVFFGPSVNCKSDIWKLIGNMQLKMDVLPCSIILKNDNVKHKNDVQDKASNSPGATKEESLAFLFKGVHGLSLEKYMFCKSQNTSDMFWKLHKDRERWWKKFSAFPGRFSSSEMMKCENEQYLDIKADFPWGKVVVERIKMFDKPPRRMSSAREENFMDACSVIKSEMILERGALTYLCDSFEFIDEENGINMLRFHRKLAPFKVAFAVVSSAPAEVQNLKDLALLLARLIRKSSISVLLLPDVCSLSLEDQFLRNDSLGIPYSVVLSNETLKTGILGLRSRDTTIQEDSHVGSLVSYVEKIMKNY